jgi:subtilisin family serine protease
VKYVEADQIVSICAQSLPWGVNRIDAELNAGSGGEGVGVAIIDTGVDLDHPDLTPVVSGINAINWFLSPDDDHGHGTHVAGTVGARDNTIGVVGVAPDCTLIAVKVLSGSGSGTTSWVALGLTFCARMQEKYNIKVANMSLAGGGFSQTVYDACAYATAEGVVCVAAAGNSFQNAANYYPAGFNNCVTVSAINSSDVFASFSNWGAVVDVTAPGVAVPSTYLNGGYATFSGTSMAAPHTAGTIALWMDDHPTDGFNEVLAMLAATGEYKNWPGDPDGISEPLIDAETL